MTTSRRRRFLAWLTRPQFTAITVAAWFTVGNIAALTLPWWTLLVIAAGIGSGQVVLNRVASWLLRRA
jgi:hypothetical protein